MTSSAFVSLLIAAPLLALACGAPVAPVPPAPTAAVPALSVSATPPPPPRAPVDLALGESHTCARLGSDWNCWGNDHAGQLGDRGGGKRGGPGAPLDLPRGTQLVARDNALCAGLPDGRVRCFGDAPGSGPSAPGALVGVVSGVGAVSGVALGASHACALTAEGRVICWGSNDSGERGEGAPAAPSIVPGLQGAVELALGKGLTCVRGDEGAIRCLGANDHGQLGLGNKLAQRSARPVEGVRNTVALAVGDEHACAIDDVGAVWCWGANALGQVDASGQDRERPTRVAPLPPARGLALGARHSCALLEGGAVACWGANFLGQTGAGRRSWREPSPVTIAGLAPAIGVSAGADHTCARLADDTIRCWGNDSESQLGDGATGFARTPVAPIVGARPSPPAPAPVDAACPGGRFHVDLAAWEAAVVAPSDEALRAATLAQLGFHPVPADIDPALDLACTHDAHGELRLSREVKLTDHDPPFRVIELFHGACERDLQSATYTDQLRIFAPLGHDDYCFVTELAATQPFSMSSCAGLDEPGPMKIALVDLVSTSHRSLRVDTQVGTCDTYPRWSEGDATFYELRGTSLVSIFTTSTLSERHSVMPDGPTFLATLTLGGGFPRVITVREEITCAPLPDGGDDPGCKPTRTNTAHRLGPQGRYSTPAPRAPR